MDSNVTGLAGLFAMVTGREMDKVSSYIRPAMRGRAARLGKNQFQTHAKVILASIRRRWRSLFTHADMFVSRGHSKIRIDPAHELRRVLRGAIGAETFFDLEYPGNPIKAGIILILAL